MQPLPRHRSAGSSAAFIAFGRARLATLGFAAVAAAASTEVAQLEAADKLAFNRDIRPILSDKCFHCHGPDSKKREADLRLDTFAGATADGAIVAGKPEESEVIARILATDPDDRMPPAKSKLGALTATEIETLKRWIHEGAEYEAHWSFIPLRFDSSASGAQRGASPIDAAVERGLAGRGRTLQPEADPTTLLRRLSFDLTGLPPSPAEVTEFVTASQQDPKGALQQAIDRLLASPQYGERMTTDWLDIARYADSYGFQVDREREVWMWRDWVVRAFNQNLPFDQFITWQLAGDLLPNSTDDQILATAFNRLHQQESEGGSVEEEYRVEYVADRVQTVATAFLGLTFECARCHDHKFDPITQKEYYGLFSMFQNIDEAGLYSFFTPSPPTPAMMLMDAPAKTRMAELQKAVRSAENKLAEAARGKGLANLTRLEGDWSPRHTAPGEIAHFTFDEAVERKMADVLNPTPPKPPEKPASAKPPARERKAKAGDAGPPDPAAVLKGENQLAPGRFGNAVAFTGDDAVDTPVGNFHRHEPFSVSLWLQTPDVKERAVVFHRSRAWTDAASRGYELLIEDGRLKWSLIHFWPGNAISVRAEQALPLNQWTHVVVTYDGSSRAAGLRIFVDGRLANVSVIRDGLAKDITGGGGDTISLGERFRDRGFKGGLIDELRVFNRDISAPFDPELEPLLASLKAARGESAAFAEAQKEIMVMRELPQPKKAFILTRGEYDKREEEVAPLVPAALPPLPAGSPPNRLGLAQWLTSPKHPLTARVTVNRLWQSLFGRGLVKTAEDFGSQGERPLYPELLDYLAARLIQSGWDVKAVIREIVSSRVYRQRSIADPAAMADDPDNQWLARGPRFRLPAEMIRDNALAASGLLKLTLGGPPVNPPEMSEAFKPFPISTGDGRYRRSLYTTWRRTSPPPALIAFDAPRRAVCTAKRERTDSPLQALILLNGEQYVEAAFELGRILHSEADGDVDRMIEGGFLRCLSRKPDPKEIEICRRLYHEQWDWFKARHAVAEPPGTPGAAADPTVPPEVAAAAILAQALLNHDECVVKR